MQYRVILDFPRQRNFRALRYKPERPPALAAKAAAAANLMRWHLDFRNVVGWGRWQLQTSTDRAGRPY